MANKTVQVVFLSLAFGFILFISAWFVVTNSHFSPYAASQEKLVEAQVEAYVKKYLAENSAAKTSSTSQPSEGKSDVSKEDFGDIIKNYLLENPQIIELAALKLREQQYAEQQKRQSLALTQYYDDIFKSDTDYIAGNPNGDVTIVEFFDYNCGFCRRAFGDLAKLIENDPEVKVIFKELPIFGADSQAAARAAVASIKQNKYFDFHRELLLQPGNANEEKALRIAKELGMDLVQLKKDMESEEVAAVIEKNMELSQNIGVEGTPLYIVGKEIIPGAPEDLYDQFVEKVKTARASKQAAN